MMKDTKRRVEVYSFFNRDGICRHLEKMAAKGWMLEKVSYFGWIYRRIESKTVKFSVTYYPEASEFDPEPLEGQKRLFEFCEYAGWKLACTSAQMQAFYSDKENLTPIETDPGLELASIRKTAKKSFLPVNLFLLAVSLLYIGLWFLAFSVNPIGFLSDSNLFFNNFVLVVMFLLPTVELVGYFRWMKRAEKAAKYGEFVKAPNDSAFQKITFGLFFCWLLWWIVDGFFNGNQSEALYMAGFFVVITLIYLIKSKMSEYLKKQKLPEEIIRKRTRTTVFSLCMILMLTLRFGINYAESKGMFANGCETYEHLGKSYIVYQDTLPLEVEDLRETSYGEYVKERKENESWFLGYYDMGQVPRFDAENYSEIPHLEYVIIDVKQPFLYDFCEKYRIYEVEQKVWNGEVEYIEEDPSVWGAQRVYHWCHKDNGYGRQYLLCYEDRIIRIGFSWDVTDEQKAIVGEKLGK